jgi:DNA polymerase I-like protein with 3'-5' exonuclease and polymerase domains
MGDKKRAKVLGISLEESKIAGAVQKTMIPKTYKMVNENAKFAVNNAYIVLNTRTNSRMWYSEILEIQRNKGNIYDREHSNVKHGVESSAKNSPIQGTQADMVKEIMVELDREADRQDLDVLYLFQLLLQVHDETVYRADKKLNIEEEKIAEFVSDKGTIEMVTLPEFVKRWHTQVCNRYLSFIKMSAEQHVGKTWTK